MSQDNPGAVQFTLSDQNSAKLTDWVNEPTVITLKQDFEMAKPSHDTLVRKVQEWNDLLKARPQNRGKGRSSVQPKLVRRQAEWRYSALTEPFLGSNKLFKVSPVSWDADEAAKQNELVLNWQFRTKLNRVKFIDDYVRFTVDDGTCVLKVGWCRVTRPTEVKVPEYTHYAIDPNEPSGQGAAQAQQFQQALQLRQDDPRAYETQVPANVQAAVEYYDESQQATYAIETGKKTVTQDKLVENRPEVEAVRLGNFYLDPTANGDLSKALFAIISFETNLAELKKYPKRYKNLDKINWSANNPLAEPDHVTSTPDASIQFQDKTRKKIVAYEWWGFYDITGTGVLEPIVCTWIGNQLIRMERNPFPDQALPFVVVPYLPVKGELFGEPDAELLGDQQKIAGAVTRGIIDLLGRSANSQQGMAKGMLDAVNKRKFDNGEDYEFNPQMNPQNGGLIQHKFPELPQSALQVLQLQNEEAESLTGVKSFSGGMSGAAYGDVAAGIRGVLDAASKREMAILRRLAQGISMVGRKLIAMNAVFLSEKEVVRVTNAQYVQLSPSLQDQAQRPGMGHNGGPAMDPDADSDNDMTADDYDGDYFVTVNREDLAGEFDLEVDISTAEVDNQKSQDMAFMIQTVGPIAPGLAQVIMADIADLKRMPALAHKIRTYQPQPDPLEQALKQAQLELVQAQIADLNSKAQLNQAKARESASNADQADLNYVEQESGVDHAREMDKIQSQARGNQALAVTEALLKSRKLPNGHETKPKVAEAVGFNELTAAKEAHPPLHQSVPAFAPHPAPVDNGMSADAIPAQPQFLGHSGLPQPPNV